MVSLSEAGLGFPHLPSQVMPGAARRGRVDLKNLGFESKSQQYALNHSRNTLNTRRLQELISEPAWMEKEQNFLFC